MSTQSVKIIGEKQLKVKLARLPGRVDAAARRAVRQEVSDVANDMREHAPVKTGELKAGIQEEFDSKAISGAAVSTAEHSKYVVHGTSDTPAQDFMTPAAVRSRRRFRGRLIDELNDEIGKGRP